MMTWRLEDGMPIREVTDMAMSEVSAVTFPAYPVRHSVSTGAEGTGRSIELARRMLLLKR